MNLFIKFVLENSRRISSAAVEHKASVFKTDRLMIMCQQLIYKYFLLTQSELEIWDSDPEMFGKYIISNNLL